MNYDTALIAAILETRDFGQALSAGASRDLLGDEAQLYWDLIQEHYDRHYEVPSVPYFEGLAPHYIHDVPADGVPALVDELKKIKLENDIDSLVRRVAELNVSSPWEAKKLLVEGSDRLNVSNQRGSTEYVVGADKDRVFKELERIRTGGGLLGLPFPFEYLNKRTQGLLPGDVWYLYGRQKSKKTFLMLYNALYYALRMNKRVLFFTREMSERKLKMRAYAMACGFDINKWIHGDLTTEQEKLLADVMDELNDTQNFIICDQSGEGFTGFKAKIEEYKPQIVMHDYWKAMADDAMTDRGGRAEHTYVARTIDQVVDYISTRAKIPALLCGHANRQGDKSSGFSSSEHAWSDHITRRVTGAMRVIHDDVSNRLGLVINEGRDVQRYMAWTVNGNLYQGFGEHLADHADWVQKVDENETEEEGSRQRNASAKPETTGESTRFTPGDWKKPAPARFRRR